MFFKIRENSKAQVTTSQALRHLLVFQVKLGADAGHLGLNILDLNMRQVPGDRF